MSVESRESNEDETKKNNTTEENTDEDQTSRTTFIFGDEASLWRALQKNEEEECRGMTIDHILQATSILVRIQEQLSSDLATYKAKHQESVAGRGDSFYDWLFQPATCQEARSLNTIFTRISFCTNDPLHMVKSFDVRGQNIWRFFQSMDVSNRTRFLRFLEIDYNHAIHNDWCQSKQSLIWNELREARRNRLEVKISRLVTMCDNFFTTCSNDLGDGELASLQWNEPCNENAWTVVHYRNICNFIFDLKFLDSLRLLVDWWSDRFKQRWNFLDQ